MSYAALEILAQSDPVVFAESIKKHNLRIIGKRDTNPLKTQVQEETVQSIASVLTEEISIQQELPANVRRVKLLAEKYGYIVELMQ
jgi:hypothetical protein